MVLARAEMYFEKVQMHIPAILISVSEFRVEDPTAVNRLADWSVR